MNKNIMNYFVFIISCFLTTYAVLTMQVTMENGVTTTVISGVVYIAPIFAISSMFNIIFENEIEEFRRKDKRIMYSIFVSKIYDKIEEGKKQTRDWLNERNKQ